MAPPQLLSSLLLLAGFTAAKTCTNLTIPIDISARQGVFKQIPVEDNLDVTAFAQEFTNIRHNYTKELLQGYQTLNGSYQISAKFCYPDSGLSTSTIQLLSHGIGFDKTCVMSYNPSLEGATDLIDLGIGIFHSTTTTIAMWRPL